MDCHSQRINIRDRFPFVVSYSGITDRVRIKLRFALHETDCNPYKSVVHKNIRRGARSMCDGEVCAPFGQT
jgi:hypothetical protein